MAQSRRLVLASISRYRRELLERLGLAFETAAPDFDEAPLAGEDAAATALRLAVGKAQSVARAFPDALIIGADQVASSEGKRLGKPGNHENAVRQLRLLSGKIAQFDTAVSLLDSRNHQIQSCLVPCQVVFRKLDERTIEKYLSIEKPYDCAASGRLQTEVVPCRVHFRELDEARIERYLRREQPYDCAGSAKAEGLGITLIARIDTEDPTSLIGLPLIALTAMLERAGLPVP